MLPEAYGRSLRRKQDRQKGWMRTKPGNTESPLDPYEHAETLRLLFEAKRHDKEGPVFITHTGEPYPW